MIYGDIDRHRRRRRLLAGALALTAAATLTACTTEKKADAPSAEAAVSQQFGPAGYGKLTITMTEAEALATGAIHEAPASTIMGMTVHSFVDGPQPDAAQVAADEKLAKELADAESDTSAAGQQRLLELRATSLRTTGERLKAFLSAGGAAFTDGRIKTIAAPEGAATAAGIKRGSTLAEVKAAYQSTGLRSTSDTMHVLPVEGNAGWVLQFETENDTVKYMALNNRE